jgi:hypothetical protein
MTLVSKLKTAALKLVFSRLGPSITAGVSTATGFLLGYIVSGTSAIGFHLDATQQTTVSLGISQTIYWLITELVNKYAGEHSGALQEALKQFVPTLEKDNWIGPETVSAAESAAQAAATRAEAVTEIIPTGKPVATIKPKPKPKKPNRYLPK